jgi:hypothetical protein
MNSPDGRVRLHDELKNAVFRQETGQHVQPYAPSRKYQPKGPIQEFGNLGPMSAKGAVGSLGAKALHHAAPIRGYLRNHAVARAHRRAPTSFGGPLVCVCVYRRSSETTLAALLGQLPPGTDVRLWALDEMLPRFQALTVGSGPGLRWELLNTLLRHAPIPEDAWVVVSDDDVVFSKGDLGELLNIADVAGFDLVQPAHSLPSISTHQFVVARPLVRACRVGFVEIGPLFAVSPAWRSEVIPFPESLGMGWGTEVLWHRLFEKGMRLGVVDQVRVVHCGEVATAYSASEADMPSRQLLAEDGFDTVFDLMTRHGRWWRWQRTPPWNPAGSSLVSRRR